MRSFFAQNYLFCVSSLWCNNHTKETDHATDHPAPADWRRASGAGAVYLFVPLPFLAVLGHSAPPADLAYPLGMLAARFLAYGAGMFFIARAPEQQRFWITNMILIQMLDLAVGLFYTATGTVSLSLSGFPMFNATLFIILLTLWRPQAARTATRVDKETSRSQLG